MQEFTQALASVTRLGARYRRAQSWWNGFFIACLLSAFLVGIGAMLGDFVRATQTNDWNDFFTQSLPGVQSILMWAGAVKWGYQWRDESLLRRRIPPLREAALQGADLLAPLAGAKDQPAPLSMMEAPAGQVTLGPFRTAIADDGIGLYIWSIVSFLLGAPLLAGVVLLIRLFQANAHGMPFSLFDGVFLGDLTVVGVCLVCATPWLLLWARRVRPPLSLIADEVGLRPAGMQPTDAQSIAWGDIRAFYFVRETGLSLRQRAPVYAVDTGAHLLLWSPGRHPKPAVVTTYELLCRLIVTRTRLPLRTLSPAANALTKAPITQETLNQSRWPEIRALAPLAITRKEAVPYAISVMLAPLLLILAIYALAIWLAMTGR